MTVRGEIYVLTSNWRNCAQRFFLTDSEYTFGSFVVLLSFVVVASSQHCDTTTTHTERTAM